MLNPSDSELRKNRQLVSSRSSLNHAPRSQSMMINCEPQMSYGLNPDASPFQMTSPHHEFARAKSTQSIRVVNRSSFPNATKLLLAKRPDGGGQMGNRFNVATNHFRCHLPEDLTVYHYDIDLKIESSRDKWYDVKKEDRSTIFREIIVRERFPLVWYDDGKALYSTTLLDRQQQQYEIQIHHKKLDRLHKYRLSINNLVRTYETREIHDFFMDLTKTRPTDSIRVLEILFKYQLRESMICDRDQFFAKNQRLTDLGDGRGMATGFYQALFLTQAGLTLNINSKFTCFYMSLSLIDMISLILKRDIRHFGLERNEALHVFHQHLKFLWVETHHTKFIRKYRIRGFGDAANRHTFYLATENNNTDKQNRVSVYDYFLEKYQIRLHYPDLPVVELSGGGATASPHYLPMECCTIQSWQRFSNSTTVEQRNSITKSTVAHPEKRYEMIMKTAENQNFSDNEYLKLLNIYVDDKNMVVVNARHISPPEIIYRHGCHENKNAVERVRIGKWSLKSRLLVTHPIENWASIFVSSTKPTQNQMTIASNFIDIFPKTLSHYGIQFFSSPELFNICPDPEQLDSIMEQLKLRSCKVILFLLNNVDDAIYNVIKSFGNKKHGIVTQCTNFLAIEQNMKARKIEMYLQNLVLKFNAKLDGINSAVSLETTLANLRTNDEMFMFFGADVTHTSGSRKNSSIAAVVGSIDSTSTRYAARLSEQYSTDGRVSVEIIKDIYSMVTDLLKLYKQNVGCLPNKIVFYRDGVDDGFFQTVLQKEVQNLKNATRALYRNSPLPLITFIVVKKRHNTRFFVYDKSDKIINVPSGTVIDTGIVHPYEFDFYLNSHSTIQGTSHPTHYHVLYDEIKFSSDEIQLLTYYLCHADFRCTKAVSIPAPVHYAHLAAYQSRYTENPQLQSGTKSQKTSILDNDDDDDENMYHTRMDNIHSTQTETTLIRLDPSIQDTMWYV